MSFTLFLKFIYLFVRYLIKLVTTVTKEKQINIFPPQKLRDTQSVSSQQVIKAALPNFTQNHVYSAVNPITEISPEYQNFNSQSFHIKPSMNFK